MPPKSRPKRKDKRRKKTKALKKKTKTAPKLAGLDSDFLQNLLQTVKKQVAPGAAAVTPTTAYKPPLPITATPATSATTIASRAPLSFSLSQQQEIEYLKSKQAIRPQQLLDLQEQAKARLPTALTTVDKQALPTNLGADAFTAAFEGLKAKQEGEYDAAMADLKRRMQANQAATESSMAAFQQRPQTVAAVPDGAAGLEISKVKELTERKLAEQRKTLEDEMEYLKQQSHLRGREATDTLRQINALEEAKRNREKEIAEAKDALERTIAVNKARFEQAKAETEALDTQAKQAVKQAETDLKEDEKELKALEAEEKKIQKAIQDLKSGITKLGTIDFEDPNEKEALLLLMGNVNLNELREVARDNQVKIQKARDEVTAREKTIDELNRKIDSERDSQRLRLFGLQQERTRIQKSVQDLSEAPQDNATKEKLAILQREYNQETKDARDRYLDLMRQMKQTEQTVSELTLQTKDAKTLEEQRKEEIKRELAAAEAQIDGITAENKRMEVERSRRVKELERIESEKNKELLKLNKEAESLRKAKDEIQIGTLKLSEFDFQAAGIPSEQKQRLLTLIGDRSVNDIAIDLRKLDEKEKNLRIELDTAVRNKNAVTETYQQQMATQQQKFNTLKATHQTLQGEMQSTGQRLQAFTQQKNAEVAAAQQAYQTEFVEFQQFQQKAGSQLASMAVEQKNREDMMNKAKEELASLTTDIRNMTDKSQKDAAEALLKTQQDTLRTMEARNKQAAIDAKKVADELVQQTNDEKARLDNAAKKIVVDGKKLQEEIDAAARLANEQAAAAAKLEEQVQAQRAERARLQQQATAAPAAAVDKDDDDDDPRTTTKATKDLGDSKRRRTDLTRDRPKDSFVLPETIFDAPQLFEDVTLPLPADRKLLAEYRRLNDLYNTDPTRYEGKVMDRIQELIPLIKTAIASQTRADGTVVPFEEDEPEEVVDPNQYDEELLPAPNIQLPREHDEAADAIEEAKDAEFFKQEEPDTDPALDLSKLEPKLAQEIVTEISAFEDALRSVALDRPLAITTVPDTLAITNVPKDGGSKRLDARGLSDSEVDDLMADYDDYVGAISYEDLVDVELPDDVPSGFILNLDDSDGPGTHWVALYIDPREDAATVEYYDSYGEDPPPEVQEAIDYLIDNNFHELDYMLKFKTNGIKRQSESSNNCGFFAIKFLQDRFDEVPWIKASGYQQSQVKQGEEEIKKVKKDFGYM